MNGHANTYPNVSISVPFISPNEENNGQFLLVAPSAVMMLNVESVRWWRPLERIGRSDHSPNSLEPLCSLVLKIGQIFTWSFNSFLSSSHL